MDIKNYLVKYFFKSITYTILLLIELYFLGFSADIIDKEPQESLGFFMFSCSIFIFLTYRFLTRKNKVI